MLDNTFSFDGSTAPSTPGVDPSDTASPTWVDSQLPPITSPTHARSYDPAQEAANIAQGQAAVQQQQAQQDQQRRVFTRYKGEDLASRGIPVATLPGGDVQAVTDATGQPLTNYDKSSGVAWDSAGNPQQTSKTSLATKNPFDGVPDWTDPSDGQIYKRANGLPWQWQGQDDKVAASAEQAQVDKLNAQTATALGGPISQTHAAFNKARVAAKATGKQLSSAMAMAGIPEVDEEGNPVDPADLKQHIDDSFNAAYAAPEANDKGFFGSDLTDNAKALRATIDKQKAQVNALADAHLANMTTMQQHSDDLDTLNAQKEQLQAGRLDQVNQKRIAAGLEPVGLTHLIQAQQQQAAGQPQQQDSTDSNQSGQSGNTFQQATTKLSPEQDQQFQAWKAKNAPNDTGGDYDLRGAFAAGLAPEKGRGHFPDTFKLPNHPTFSDQSQYSTEQTPGGHWGTDTNGKDTFQPSAWMASDPARMQQLTDYFKRVEPDATLLPAPTAKQAATQQAADAGQHYTVDQSTGFPSFNPDAPLKGLLAAKRAGLVTDEEAKQIMPHLAEVQLAKKGLDAVAGNNQQLKAGLSGLAKGMAAAAAGTAAAAAAEPAIGTASLATGVAAPITAGALNMMTFLGASYATVSSINAAEKAVARYSNAIASIQASEKLQPEADELGNLTGILFNPIPGVGNVASSASKLVKTYAIKAADNSVEGGTAKALQWLAKETGTALGTGAAFELAVRPAMDAAANVIKSIAGAPTEDVQAPTVSSVATSAAIAVLLHGYNIDIGKVTPTSAADILATGGQRSPADMEIYLRLQKAIKENPGVQLDISGSQATRNGIPLATNVNAEPGAANPQQSRGMGGPTAPAGPASAPNAAQPPSQPTEPMVKPTMGPLPTDQPAPVKTQEQSSRSMGPTASTEAQSTQQGGQAEATRPTSEAKPTEPVKEVAPEPSKSTVASVPNVSQPVATQPQAQEKKDGADDRGDDLVNTHEAKPAEQTRTNEPEQAAVAQSNGDTAASQPASETGHNGEQGAGSGRQEEVASPETNVGGETSATQEVGASGSQATPAPESKGSTQVTLSKEDAAPIQQFAKSIPDSDIYKPETEGQPGGYGREDESHVTALYGLTGKGDDAKAVQAAVAKHGPIKVKLGKISKFSNPDSPYDVLKVDVHSPDLHLVNKSLKGLEHKNDFPNYHPHLTIAHVKKGEGDKYVGDTRFEGKEITIGSLTHSSAARAKTEIPLTGGKSPTLATAETSTQPAQPVTGEAQKQRVRLNSGPQTYTVEEKLPQTDVEKANGEQAYRVRNEKTGEVSEVQHGDMKPVGGGDVRDPVAKTQVNATSTQSQPSAQPAKKSSNPKERSQGIIGATVGDTITPSVDVGYATGGRPMVIEEIDKKGNVYLKNPETGSGTSLSIAELLGAERKGVTFAKSEAPEAKEPAPQPEAAKTPPIGGKKRQARQSAFTDHPLIQEIQNAGGILSKTGAKKQWGGDKFTSNASLWDDSGDLLKSPLHNAIYNENGLPPDQMAAHLVDAHLLPPNATERDMWRNIGNISESSQRIDRARVNSEKNEKELTKQRRSFEAAAFKAQPGEQAVRVSDLKEGDQVKIGGETMKVTEVDPFGTGVTLEDGSKFGAQFVDEDKVLYTEHEVPKLKAGENQGELVGAATKTEEQLAQEKAEEAARLKKLQQAQDVRVGANKPLKAGEDIRPERDMFGADKAEGDDLFDQKQPAKPSSTLDAKTQQDMKDAFNSLFAANPATEDQQAIPAEKLGAFINLASTLVSKGIDTPEKLAAEIHAIIGERGHKYSQALWDAVGMVKPALRGTHKWGKVYRSLTPAQNDSSVKGNDVPISKNLESDRGNAAATEPSGEGGVPTERGATSEAGRPSSDSGKEGRNPVETGPMSSDVPAAPHRAQGDQPVRNGEHGATERTTGSELTTGSGGTHESGVEVDAERASSAGIPLIVPAAASTLATSGESGQSLADILKSSPSLTPEQAGDVAFIRNRLKDHPGVLITNGTGTGKTFSGLGAIKSALDAGAKHIIITTPSGTICDSWVNTAKQFFGIKDIVQLDDTKGNGNGSRVVVTTYANLGQNDSLVNRPWDMVVADESHKLSASEKGTDTDALRAVRALTWHPGGMSRHRDMLHPVETKKLFQLNQIKKPTEAQVAERTRLRNVLDGTLKTLQEQQKALGESNRPKALFLSATPFAHHFSLDYGEGYLFNHGAERTSGGYNTPSARGEFYVSNFGYRMRYGKLTKPENASATGILERRFAEKLMREKAMAGRSLDVPHDYSREFVLTENALGTKIDEVMNLITEDARFRPLMKYLGINDYLQRRYLLEALKAKEAVERINQHLALGRKVVVFHDYKKGGTSNPFKPSTIPAGATAFIYQDGKSVEINLRDTYETLRAEVPGFDEMVKALDQLNSPLDVFKGAFPQAGVFNGDVTPKNRLAVVKQFNTSGSPMNVIIAQRDSIKEGNSLHDRDGKHQRVSIDLGIPGKPTDAIQSEGRIYRHGVQSNAVMEYLTTGTNWERWTFAQTIAQRASTAENLAMGERARALLQSFSTGYNDAVAKAPSADQGTGGKEMDSARENGNPYKNAIALYYTNQKKTSRNKASEGVDYFATPEPVGYKMVEWAGIRPGEKVLEPSAGHGAIARFFPDATNRHAVEPSNELAGRLALNSPDTEIHQDHFENYNVINKFDAVVMNPPFGTAGKTAMEHLAKAVKHLKEGGRLVALIPMGSSMEKRFNAWYESDEAKGVHKVAEILLPSVAFERAGTNVSTRIVVLDKSADAKHQVTRDFTDVTTTKELFERMENTSVPERTEPKVAAKPEEAPRPQVQQVPTPTSDSDYSPASFMHTQKGTPVFVAKMARRFSDTEYAAAKSKAQAAGGYYSSFKGSGAIPGFHFKTAEARDSFIGKKERPFTYGDTFRAPDGKEGILRGLGGMGSDRVRLVDDAGKDLGYYNRSDLTEVRRNDSNLKASNPNETDQRPEDQSANGAPEAHQAAPGNKGLGGEQQRGGPEASHAAVLEYHGLEVEENEEKSGEAGFGVDLESPTIYVSSAKIAKAKAYIVSEGGDGEAWAHSAMGEEIIHHQQSLVLGENLYSAYKGLYKVMSPEARAEIRDLYPDNLNPVVQAAEYIRMAAQRRAGLPLTESHYQDTSKMEAILDGAQHPAIEQHLASLKKLSDAVPKTPPIGGKIEQAPSSEVETQQGRGPPVLNAGNPLSKFADDDIKPLLESSVATLGQAWRQVQAAFNPMALADDKGKQAGYALRERGAKIDRSAAIAWQALRKAHKMFAKMDHAANLAFMHAVETDQPLTGALGEAKDKMRELLDAKRDEAMDAGQLQTAIENYFPHIWENPAKAKAFLADYFAKAPMRGSGAFRKQRKIPTIQDGIAAGLKPVSYNPVDLVVLKRREMDKWITGTQFLGEMKTRGLAKFKRSTEKAQEGWSAPKDRMFEVWGPREIEVTNRNGKIVDTATGDEISLEDAGLEVPPFEGTKMKVTLPGRLLMGHYIMPDELTGLVDNHLGPGLRQKSGLFRAYLGVSNVMNQFQLGFSAFHLGFTSVDTMVSEAALAIEKLFDGKPMEAIKSAAKIPGAPFTTAILGSKVLKEWATPGSQGAEIADILNAAVAAGARAGVDEFYKTEATKKMMKAFEEGNLLGGILRVPFAAVEQASRPIMEHIVPMQKMGVFARMMQNEMEKNPNMTHDELRVVAAKAWDSVDNRLGQVVYDNIFWNKAIKDLGMASVRSLGWNMGTLREVGGGLVDAMKAAGKAAPRLKRDPNNPRRPKIEFGEMPEVTHRMAYMMALPLIVGIMGAIIMKLATGKAPDTAKDYFFPQIGGTDANGNPQRISLPSYMKDIYAYKEAPGSTVEHKLHPALAMIAEMLENEDYYGVQIRNEDDSLIKQALSELGYVGKAFEPFASRGIRQLHKVGAPTSKQILPFFGITPAPASINRTDAEKEAAKINKARMPAAPQSEQQFERRMAKSELVGQIRRGDRSHIAEDVRKGLIKATDVKAIEKKAAMTPLQAAVNTMSLEQVQKVAKLATPAEKRQLAPILARKQAALAKKAPMWSGF